MSDIEIGDDRLGTSTSRLVHWIPLLTPARCLHAETPETQQMPRGVESQSVQGGSLDTGLSFAQRAQLCTATACRSQDSKPGSLIPSS